MTEPRRRVSLGLDGEQADEGQHICFLYSDDDERLRVIARFLQGGLQSDEKLLYLVDSMSPETLLDALEAQGLDVRSSDAGLEVVEAASGYVPGDTFDIDETLAAFRKFYRQAVDREGHAGARAAGEMGWCLAARGCAEPARVLEFEARLNLLLREHPCTTCCQYDVRRFDGETILDVLRVHPVMIVRGQLVHNPYYTEPEEFLARRQAEPPEGRRP